MSELTVGDLHLDVRRSPRRRSVQITIERDGSLLLLAPEGVEVPALKKVVEAKRFWLYTKLAEQKTLSRPISQKQYVSGEGFSYLGRSYRLKLIAKQDQAVKLVAGRFLLLRELADQGRKHIVRWYTERGTAWLAKRVPQFAHRVGVEPTGVIVRDLGYRWGSCGKNGGVNFHWRMMQLPPALIDYIIVHELVHLIEPHHGRAFWLRVERAMPDFAERQQRLNDLGVATGAI